MNRTELKENAPEYIKKNFPVFEKYQKVAMESLIEFDRVCRQNGIQYFLAWGSLLGAIRGNGQIPWDYDADVFIHYKEKELVIAALKKDLGSDFYFECPEVCDTCNQFFIRITKKGHRTSLVHLDVFFLIGTDDDIDKRAKHVAELKKLNMNWLYKRMNIRYAALGDIVIALKIILHKLLLLGISAKKMKQRFDELCSMYPYEECQFLVCADREAPNHTFPKYLFEEAEDHTYEDKICMVPKEYQHLLQELYGDYMKYPSNVQIYGELSRSIDRFIRYEKISKGKG